MALDTRFPAGMTTPAQIVYNDESSSFAKLEAGASSTEFPSRSLGTSELATSEKFSAPILYPTHCVVAVAIPEDR